MRGLSSRKEECYEGMRGGDGGVGRGRVIASLCYVPPSHSEEFKRRWMGGWWGEESLNRVKTSGKNGADDRRWYSERLWRGERLSGRVEGAE